jgi:hypothetical protein
MRRLFTMMAAGAMALGSIAIIGATGASAATTVPTLTLKSTVGPVLGVSAGTITATASVAGTVAFLIGTTPVTGCTAVATATATPFTAICTWTPTANGLVTFNATLTPTDATDFSTATATLPVTVVAPFSTGNQYMSLSVDQVTGGGSPTGSTSAGSCSVESLYGQGAMVVFRMWGIDNTSGAPLLSTNVKSAVIEDLPGATAPVALAYSTGDGYWTYGWKTSTATPVGAVPYKVVVTLNPVNPVYKTVNKAVVKTHIVAINGKRMRVAYVAHEKVKVLISATVPAESYTYTETGLPSVLTIAALA